MTHALWAVKARWRGGGIEYCSSSNKLFGGGGWTEAFSMQGGKEYPHTILPLGGGNFMNITLVLNHMGLGASGFTAGRRDRDKGGGAVAGVNSMMTTG